MAHEKTGGCGRQAYFIGAVDLRTTRRAFASPIMQNHLDLTLTILEGVLDGIRRQFVHDGTQPDAGIDVQLDTRIQAQIKADFLTCEVIKGRKIGAQSAEIIAQHHL